MKWEDIIEHGSLVIGSDTYDLSHLKDSTVQIIIPESKGYPEIKTNLMVRYSSHCVSENVKCYFSDEYEVIDRRLVRRKFSLERYHLSFNLPGVFSNIFSSNQHKFFSTQHQNFLIIKFLNSTTPKNHYHIFFDLKKERNVLKIYVESAYALVENKSQEGDHRAIRPALLLAKTFRNQKIPRR